MFVQVTAKNVGGVFLTHSVDSRVSKKRNWTLETIDRQAAENVRVDPVTISSGKTEFFWLGLKPQFNKKNP